MDKKFILFAHNFKSETFDGKITTDSISSAIEFADAICRIEADVAPGEYNAVIAAFDRERNVYTYRYTGSEIIIEVYPEEDYPEFKKDCDKVIEKYLVGPKKN